MNDRDIRQHVLDELSFDPTLNANDIGVAVDAGIVSLTGHVQSYAQKINAEKAALRVKGVRGIAQELEVRFSNEPRTADDQIAKRAVSMLDWNTELPHGAIQVRVQDAWVTLSGTVQWRHQRDGAEASIRRLAGIAGISNLIDVRPALTVANVEDKIVSALRRSADVEADRIKVTVSGDEVVLEGRISAWGERAIAERAAWSVPGVAKVKDHLMLG